MRRWTEACPLPLLAVACLLWLGAASMLLFPVAYGGVLPVFGRIVSGLPGIALALCLAGFWFWLARLWYRARVAGWWALLATLIVFGVSNLITFSRVDIMDLYQRMGYPEAQLDLIRRQGLASSQIMLWASMAGLIPMLGYLVWIKSFFHNPKPQSESPS